MNGERSTMQDEPAPTPSAPPAAQVSVPATPAPSTPVAAPEPALTPEEQMALFEKELKETDWGHQPC